MSSKRSFDETRAPKEEALASKRRFDGIKNGSCNTQQQQRRRQLDPYDEWRTNDEVHSTIRAGPVISAIIGTPPVQRLRHIRQLGACDQVYMNANHSRFEHSLGVMHLAGSLCGQIKSKQPNLKVTEKDELCSKLSGLLHDMGHGLFSHVYEQFVKKVLKKYRDENPHLDALYGKENYPDLPEKWQHEIVSLMMIDCALEFLGLAIDLDSLDAPLKHIGGDKEEFVDARSMRVFLHDGKDDDLEDMSRILTSRDFVFIKECIFGKPIPEVEAKFGEAVFIGRLCPTKEWLYDIVCNRHSGLDVDKLDYFARDDRRANRGSGEIDMQMIDEAFVTWAECTALPGGKCVRCNKQFNKSKVGKHLMICYPKKSYERCFKVFETRFNLHNAIYQHKTVSAATFVICDILCKADPYLRIPTSIPDGRIVGKAKCEYKSLPMSRAMLDPIAFLRLTDSSIFDVIDRTEDENLKEAKELIWKYKARQLYKLAVEQSISRKKPAGKYLGEKTADEIEKQLIEFSVKFDAKHDVEDGTFLRLEKRDIIVEFCSMHYGSGDSNPCNSLRFLEKENKRNITCSDIELLPMAKKIDEEDVPEAKLPREFQKRCIRVYVRNPKKVDLASNVFRQWYEEVSAETSSTPDFAVMEDGGMEQCNNQDAIQLTQESYDGYEDVDDDHDCLDGSDFVSPRRPYPGANGHTPKITPPRNMQQAFKKNLFSP